MSLLSAYAEKQLTRGLTKKVRHKVTLLEAYNELQAHPGARYGIAYSASRGGWFAYPCGKLAEFLSH